MRATARVRLPRRALVAAGALVVALVAGFLFVRDSSFVQVERVHVRGASGPDGPKVEATLRRTAREMTTLNADAGRLRKAVQAFPTVDDVALDRDLPNELTITVLERRPVGVVDDGGRRVPVTADGRLLRGATPPGDVPELGLKGGAGLSDPKGRRLLAVLAAAPDQLRRKARRAYMGDKGLTVAMREGPSVYFGTAQDLRAKWLAAARVLADPSAEGARYVDVRVPERTAAGGLAPLVDAEGETDGVPPGTEPGTVPEPVPDPAAEPAPGAVPGEAGATPSPTPPPDPASGSPSSGA